MLIPRNIVVRSTSLFIALLAPAMAFAQSAADSSQPPVAYASVSELNGILEQLQKTSQSMQTNLSNTRIEKWKTDASSKQQTLANVESIQRNLKSSLPETITQLNNAPEDLASSFKLYRNLDALYDVFGPLAESAGAFGSKDEYQNLGNDLNALQTARHALGERMQ